MIQTFRHEKEILDNINETHAYISIGLTHIVPIILGTYCLFAVPQPKSMKWALRNQDNQPTNQASNQPGNNLIANIVN